ncbi:hypothetical protein [Gulosibacter bifidus]|uniref:Uncharacterized protein n=1 Tax=Gulosibacter bifidus TaxID=272239 RepID=A0ABW5RIN9_9MICO|nr:hypothetical protein [Gulosibacter bifidus]
MKFDPIQAVPSTWTVDGEETPCIRLKRVHGDNTRFLAAIGYDQARTLADQLHDAADAAQTNPSQPTLAANTRITELLPVSNMQAIMQSGGKQFVMPIPFWGHTDTGEILALTISATDGRLVPVIEIPSFHHLETI